MAYDVLTAFEPSSGWRWVSVSERRRNQEFAEEEVRGLAEEVYPDAEKIRLVSDSLSTTRRLSTRLSPEAGPAPGVKDRVCLHAGA